MTSVVLVSHQLAGHRAAYIEQFSAVFRKWSWDVALVRHWSRVLFDRRPVLFLMVEESTAGYVVAACVRCLLGARTAGLLFRQPNRRSIGGGMKQLVLGGLTRVPLIHTLSIVPFPVTPDLQRVASGWIHDPQLWDYEPSGAVVTDLSRRVQKAAGGRRILVALGMQNRSKGFELLCQAYLASPALRDDWFFIAAGQVAPDMADIAQAFVDAGGMVVDRFVDDDELRSLYGVADMAWSLYHPIYDQASGIFGRAVQVDVPALVRSGSAISRLAGMLGARRREADFDPASVVAALQAPEPLAPGRADISELARVSLDTLQDALAGAR